MAEIFCLNLNCLSEVSRGDNKVALVGQFLCRNRSRWEGRVVFQEVSQKNVGLESKDQISVVYDWLRHFLLTDQTVPTAGAITELRNEIIVIHKL